MWYVNHKNVWIRDLEFHIAMKQAVKFFTASKKQVVILGILALNGSCSHWESHCGSFVQHNKLHKIYDRFRMCRQNMISVKCLTSGSNRALTILEVNSQIFKLWVIQSVQNYSILNCSWPFQYRIFQYFYLASMLFNGSLCAHLYQIKNMHHVFFMCILKNVDGNPATIIL